MAVENHCECGYLAHWHEGPHLRCPGTTKSIFRAQAPPVKTDWREIIAQRGGKGKRDAVVVQILEPLVVPRAATPDEIPGAGTKARAGRVLGAAHAGGWSHDVLYGVTGAGIERCCVKLAREGRRAAAVWRRKIGTGEAWVFDCAFVWAESTYPRKVGLMELVGAL